MNNNRKLKIKKMMKKGATISLCAVLAGGIGVGAYEGINYFSGAQSVQAATDSSENLTLMKSDKNQIKTAKIQRLQNPPIQRAVWMYQMLLRRQCFCSCHHNQVRSGGSGLLQHVWFPVCAEPGAGS